MDGINGVGTSYSSFVPSRCDAKNADVIIGYRGKRMSPEMACARKICDSLICCAPHNK
jgi:hypothetical protein